MKDVFLQLVSSGIGTSRDTKISKNFDWNTLEVLAKKQGLFAIVFDGVEQLLPSLRPQLTTWLRWIGEVQLEEARCNQQRGEAFKMARLFHRNGIRTYVLKGDVVSECYPKPQHRVCCDLDCFLLPEESNFDAWDKGNRLIEDAGGKVEEIFYKNSTFHFPSLMVENHKFLTPFRGNYRLRQLEVLLQGMVKNGIVGQAHDEDARFEGSELWRPPVLVSALFLIEHAYSHFLHEGLTWRHVLDWVMFSRKHKDKINWEEFDSRIDEFGFRKFYDAFIRLGKYLLGEIQDNCLTVQEKKMLDDVWRPLDLHESVRGFKGKLALAGNTWRARWKYRYFTEITWFTALWIQMKGFLFEKTPKLY